MKAGTRHADGPHVVARIPETRPAQLASGAPVEVVWDRGIGPALRSSGRLEMRHKAQVLPIYKSSFFTSPDRGDGLRLKVLYGDATVFCDVMLDGRFDNGAGFAFGGILFGVMDVLIWYIILMEERKVAVTRKVDVDFFEPVRCNVAYVAKARVERIDEKDILARGWIEDDNGAVCTQVRAVFRESKGITIADVIDQLDFSNCGPEMHKFFLDASRNYR